VRFDTYTRHLFSRDASMYAIEPIGVVFPRDGSEAAAVVATAAEFGVPVLPRRRSTRPGTRSPASPPPSS
jgi:FAD/FMN-containing dehydrogenase